MISFMTDFFDAREGAKIMRVVFVFLRAFAASRETFYQTPGNSIIAH
jgi:hypothetical protein